MNSCFPSVKPWDASQILAPDWAHVQQAFVKGAMEMKENPGATVEDIERASDGWVKQVFEKVDPVSEHALRTESWTEPPAFHQHAYLIFKHGVYRHECCGIFTDYDTAQSLAIRLMETEPDCYHYYVVIKFGLDKIPFRKSLMPLHENEWEAKNTIVEPLVVFVAHKCKDPTYFKPLEHENPGVLILDVALDKQKPLPSLDAWKQT